MEDRFRGLCMSRIIHRCLISRFMYESYHSSNTFCACRGQMVFRRALLLRKKSPPPPQRKKHNPSQATKPRGLLCSNYRLILKEMRVLLHDLRDLELPALQHSGASVHKPCHDERHKAQKKRCKDSLFPCSASCDKDGKDDTDDGQ